MNFIPIWRVLASDLSIYVVISGKWFKQMRARTKKLVYGRPTRLSYQIVVDYNSEIAINKYGVFSTKI